MAKKPTPQHPPTMDERIKNLLQEGPLVALYFSMAISQFKEQIEQMSDYEIKTMVENLLHPDTVRSCVNHIYNRLHLIDDK